VYAPGPQGRRRTPAQAFLDFIAAQCQLPPILEQLDRSLAVLRVSAVFRGTTDQVIAASLPVDAWAGTTLVAEAA
jgi:hypothetical protein